MSPDELEVTVNRSGLERRLVPTAVKEARPSWLAPAKKESVTV